DVDDFLTARAGVESFIWTNPRGKAIIVVCDSHTVKRYPGYQVLTATFRQVFES
ncbi:phage tail protein, partial [Klebsiella pneumoniae]